MITTQNIDGFGATLDKIVEQLPVVLAGMRETAEDRERVIEALEAARHEIDSLNIAIIDLREDKRTLDGRVTALLAENARLECLLGQIGSAIKQSAQVQNSLQELATTRNGKLIEGRS